MIHTARALGLKLMLGCMVESAILSTAAAHLSPLVDWADLDGPFLTAEDPFTGLRYDESGRLVIPDAPGLGVTESLEPAVTVEALSIRGGTSSSRRAHSPAAAPRRRTASSPTPTI